MSDVEIGLAPSSVTKTSLDAETGSSCRVDIQIGVELLHRHPQPAGGQQLTGLEAVSPLPNDEATPPVTKTCLVPVHWRSGRNASPVRMNQARNLLYLRDFTVAPVPVPRFGLGNDGAPRPAPVRHGRVLARADCDGRGSGPYRTHRSVRFPSSASSTLVIRPVGTSALSTVEIALPSAGSERTIAMGDPPVADPMRPTSDPPCPRAAIAAASLPTSCPWPRSPHRRRRP